MQHIAMLSEETKLLEFNQYKNKAPFIIYAYLECLIEKNKECKNNSVKSSTTKVNGYILSGFSMYTILSCKNIKNKQDVYRGKYCMEKFC